MSDVYIPRQCSEQETGGNEDCTWCTGLMLENAAYARTRVAPTRHEYEALRVAGGDGPAEHSGDGSNYSQLAYGMDMRYGWRPLMEVGLTFNEAWDRFAPGFAMGWQGSMGSIGQGARYRRWDPPFRGAHSFLVVRLDDQDRGWLLNPQAPNSFAGEWISRADLRAYYDGIRVPSIIYARVGSRVLPDTATEDTMKFVNANGYGVTSVRRLPVKRGTPWLFVDGSPGGVFSADAELTVLGLADSVGGTFVVVIDTGVPYVDRITRSTLALVRSKAAVSTVPVTPPVDQSATVKAAVTSAVDHIAAAETALATAIQEARPR